MASTDPNHNRPTLLTTSERFLRWNDVADRVGLCRSQCHALAAQGKFPKPRKLVPGGRASAWLESEISAWIAERAAEVA